jgi:hypothetical protein
MATFGVSEAVARRADRIQTLTENAVDILERVNGLKDSLEISSAAAASLCALIQADHSPVLAAISECTSTAANLMGSLAAGAALVAPALAIVSSLLSQIANAAANPGLVKALACRLVALRPILLAAARSDNMAREHEATLAAITQVLHDAVGAVERVTSRGFVSALWNASGDRAKIEGAETSIDKWVLVLTAAIAVALGSEVRDAVVAASEAAAKAQDETLRQLAVVGVAVDASAADARAFHTKLDGVLERQGRMVRVDAARPLLLG